MIKKIRNRGPNIFLLKNITRERKKVMDIQEKKKKFGLPIKISKNLELNRVGNSLFGFSCESLFSKRESLKVAL